ncbi:5-guanidino-2-oxopentanoate decarboxylase [Primorskyibacter sp. S187A]|uniref:5-guanidino-2-oxopentanoate decarboxylase n=1 Tax=Primorskyibacter sp. S187A TaxID=3415130 RepID=UPI003C7BC02E
MGKLGAEMAHALAARGVDVIFGIPGVHNIEMYRGIEEAGITHVLARHEGGAAFMADGYARASGRPGVCLTITGPGLTNAMTGLGQAYSDSVPVLCLSSCLDQTAGPRGQLHQMRDQRAAAATVCDWALEAQNADEAYALLDRAFAEFASQRPRPKYIQVPIAAAGEEAAPAAPPAARPAPAQVAYGQISEIAARLLAAQKPLIIFGGGAARAGVHAGALLQMTGAAAFTTYAGRGLVPVDYPLSFGAMLPRPESARVLAAADLVVVFGSELAEVDLWRDELGGEALVIRVDLDPSVLAQCKAGDMPVLGDAAGCIEALGVAIRARAEDQPPKWAAGEVAQMRARWRAEVDAERPGIVPLCDALRSMVPRDALIYSDMTQFAYVAKEVWDMGAPGLWHHPTGFGTLGYALPAAIGGAMARRGAPVFCIAGDYGLQYTLQELATAVELKLPVVILLWDNTALKEIADAMTGAQIPPTATHVENPDFLALARAYGARATEPGTLAALSEAVMQAQEAQGPTLIRMTPRLLG